MSVKIELKSGRTIQLTSLNQALTYDGLLEGRPNRQLNDLLISRAMAKAEKESPQPPYVHLIKPIRTAVESGKQGFSWLKERLNRPEVLPAVVGHGRFKSDPTARNPTMDYSLLTVVWFQSEFGPPIQDAALQQIVEINWDKFATDYEA